MSGTLIVDNDPDIRVLVRLLLEGAATPITVAGEAASGEEALRLWRERQPDVIVLDANMPDLHGEEVAEIILGEQPDQAIVMFTSDAAGLHARRAVHARVRAVVSKPDVSLLVAAIRDSLPVPLLEAINDAFATRRDVECLVCGRTVPEDDAMVVPTRPASRATPVEYDFVCVSCSHDAA